MSPRSSHFHSRHPSGCGGTVDEKPARIAGPLPFLNPTRAHFQHDAPSSISEGRHYYHHWTSRNNRKGRHALTLTPSTAASSSINTPARTSAPQEIAKGILRMFTVFPVWDVSYLVATTFTLGSIVWVVNAFFVFLPLLDPSTAFMNEVLYGGGITAFIGATVFEVGSVLLILEAVNEHQEGCFGWAVEEAWDEVMGKTGTGSASKALQIHAGQCSHHHANKRNLVGSAPRSIREQTIDNNKPSKAGNQTWTWIPSLHLLRTHYMHELGFLACASQLFGATVFWIAGFTALPGIYNTMSPGLVDGIYWTPQVVGGCGFIVSGTLFMLETQKRWYSPALRTLGWHIGLWNLIGGVGFTLSPAFGYDTHFWAQYQAACSTFWGSWAFLVGSVLQWYESLDKFPVEVKEV